MNIEDIKKLSKEVNQVTGAIEFIERYFSLLRTLVSKEKIVADKAMTLYLALKNDGMLGLIQDQLNDMSDKTNEADGFIFTVAENLENKKLVFNSRGTSDAE